MLSFRLKFANYTPSNGITQPTKVCCFVFEEEIDLKTQTISRLLLRRNLESFLEVSLISCSRTFSAILLGFKDINECNLGESGYICRGSVECVNNDGEYDCEYQSPGTT